MRTTILLGFFALLAVGCGNKQFSDGDADVDTDADTDGDTDGDTDADTDADDCDLLTAAGCAETENCDTDLSNQHTCIDSGTGEQDAACGTTADCARLHYCNRGVCSRWCSAAGSECPEGSVCSSVVVGSDGTTEIGRVCKATTDCDVLEQTGCEGGDICFVVRTDGIFDCGGGGAGGQDAACTYLSDCSGGFQCDEKVCKQYCNAEAGGGDPACPGTHECIGQGFESLGGVQVGYCEPL